MIAPRYLLLNTAFRSMKPACVTSLHRPLPSRSTATFALKQKPSFVRKYIDKLLYNTVHKSRMNVIGHLLYESTVDKIDYAKAFDRLGMPDTYYTWFAITELYVWMLTTRLMAEASEGEFVRNRLVGALWADAQLRTKKIGLVSSTISPGIKELSQQFNAALIAYDEGIQSADTVLASALWRRLYQHEFVQPEHLDVLVRYVRKQVHMLDNLTKEEIFKEKKIPWDPLIS